MNSVQVAIACREQLASIKHAQFELTQTANRVRDIMTTINMTELIQESRMLAVLIYKELNACSLHDAELAIRNLQTARKIL